MSMDDELQDHRPKYPKIITSPMLKCLVLNGYLAQGARVPDSQWPPKPPQPVALEIIVSCQRKLRKHREEVNRVNVVL